MVKLIQSILKTILLSQKNSASLIWRFKQFFIGPALSLVVVFAIAQAPPVPSPSTPPINDAYTAYPIDSTPWSERSREDMAFNASYEDLNTFKLQRFHYIDPFEWIYSQGFAEKFRMPRKGIDANLKGALAMAWRMTSMGKKTCGYGGNAQSCWPTLTCQLDIYFDSKAPLPWNYTDVVRDNMIEGMTSDSYLPRLQSNSKWWRYLDSLPKSSKGPVLPEGRLEMRYVKGGSIDVGGLRLWLFDRDYEPGVVLLSYEGACPVFDGKGPGFINYYTEAELTRTRGVDPQSVYRIEFPETFIKKIRTVYLAQQKPIQETTQRIYEEFQRASGSPASVETLSK